MKKVLEVKKISKVIGKKKILTDISFELEEGKILGIIGKNGAGKSTLLKTIVGLSSPSEGSIIINGYDIKKDYEKAISEVGCVIEVPALYENLTGKENLDVFKIMFKNISEERINEIIKLVSLEESKYKKLKIYSLGMRQRLGIAVSLLNNPKLLILDEPTNGLDPVGINDLRKFLKSLKSTSIIISSHILSEIENICDEVIFIHNGKIIDKRDIKANKKFKFHVDDILKTRILLNDYNINEELEVTIDENDIPNINKILVNNNIKVYKISESKNNLEKDFLSLIEDKK